MQTRFTLTIDLGNDAMQTGDDIARALQAVAHTVSSRYDGTTPPDDTAPIRDENGNTTGRWTIASDK